MSGRRGLSLLSGLALLGVTFFSLNESEGQVFRYVDPRGVIHYSDVSRDERFEKVKGYGGNSSSPPVAETPRRSTLSDHIEVVSGQYNLDPRLVRAVIRAESNFDPWARSPKGAMGLMQLMPETARFYKVSNPFDPYENVQGGARHLRYLLDLYHGDLELALAAYNAGQKRVQRYQGVPPYRETRSYIRRVLDFFRREGAGGRQQGNSGRSKKGGTIYRYISPDGVTLFTDTPR